MICCSCLVLDIGLLFLLMFCALFFVSYNELLICGYYGRPEPMAAAFRQPSIDISANVSILFVSSVVVNKILSFSHGPWSES